MKLWHQQCLIGYASLRSDKRKGRIVQVEEEEKEYADIRKDR